MKFKQNYIFVISLILLSSFTIVQNGEKDSDIKLITTQTNFEVGSRIVLKFSSQGEIKPLLYCSNSYGSTLISPHNESATLEYQIPENISIKIGVLNWKLLND